MRMDTKHKYRKLGGWMLVWVILDAYSFISVFLEIPDGLTSGSNLLQATGLSGLPLTILMYASIIIPVTIIPTMFVLLYKHNRKYIPLFLGVRIFDLAVILLTIILFGMMTSVEMAVALFVSLLITIVVKVVLLSIWYYYFKESKRVHVYFMSEQDYANYMAEYAQQMYEKYGPGRADGVQQTLLEPNQTKRAPYTPPQPPAPPQNTQQQDSENAETDK
ncbi:DUF2569 family protein [Eubacteriales bacterium OttesenSCG-928-N14]|nr:DUF2569 family protein [Eubacteriales bacterium OttesenSCG-928-N14]